MSAMLMILVRQMFCLRMVLRCRHISLSGLDADKLLYLFIAYLNSFLENSFHRDITLLSISLRTLSLT